MNRLAPAGINLYVKCASSEQRFRAQGAAHSSTVRRSLFPYGTKVVQEGGSSRVTQRCRCEYFNPLSSVKAEFDRGKVSKVPLQFSIARATLLKSASRAAHFISPPADFAGSACHCHHRGLTAKRNLLSSALEREGSEQCQDAEQRGELKPGSELSFSFLGSGVRV